MLSSNHKINFTPTIPFSHSTFKATVYHILNQQQTANISVCTINMRYKMLDSWRILHWYPIWKLVHAVDCYTAASYTKNIIICHEVLWSEADFGQIWKFEETVSNSFVDQKPIKQTLLPFCNILLVMNYLDSWFSCSKLCLDSNL